MKINPKQMEKMMRQMGVQSENIDAVRVIIECPDKRLVINGPQVTKVKMQGQESLQVVGTIEEEATERFRPEDVQMIVDQTGCSEDEAKTALEKEGDIAKAILSLKKD